MSKKEHRAKPNGTSKAAAKERRERFANMYIDLGENAKRAHMAVYGSIESTAGSEGHKLIKDPEVKAIIETRRAEISRKFALSAERVTREIARVAFYDPGKLFDANGQPLALHLVDPDTRAALSAVEIEVINGRVVYRVRPHSKTAALEMAKKILRLDEAPPPLPPDANGEPVAHDPKDTLRRLAFLLAQGKQAKLLEQKPESD